MCSASGGSILTLLTLQKAMDPPIEPDDAHPCWAELPPNVLLRIFEDLTLPNLVAAGQACLAWHAVTTSDSLWGSILQQHCAGACVSSNSRVRLGQLRTASLWATGTFSAETTAAAPESMKTLPLSVSCTEPRKLWSAHLARQQAGTTSSNFAVSAAAGGRSHLVLLGGAGQVVDTRSLFLLPSQHDALSASTVCATAAAANLRLLLVDLLLQQQQQQPGGGSMEPEPHWHFTASWLRAGQHIAVHKPWLPPGGVPVTSVASGDGHVLAVAGGRVWGWGSNQVGQLGLGSCTPWQATPADITAALDRAWKPKEAGCVQAAACGSNHSVLLTNSGAVYTAGCNSSGQCGQDKELQECPVFCQPHMAEAVLAAGAAPSAGSARMSSSRQQRSTDSSASPAASTLPDPAAVSDDPPTEPRALLPPAAAIAAGPSNTLVATRSGRVLVCGASGSGQCGAAWVRAPACPGFVDLGPEVSWHGLTRPSAAEVDAAGGQVADALAKVVAVAAGEGTCYALTDAGEVFAWGQGSKGQLGTGGCPKVQATPAKLPWARQIRHISVSPTGQFAAAVDTAGKLHTWGAGKWGHLGHGDTSKRTVGRLVKQLRHLDVLQVCCCAESMLVLTAQHIPRMMQQQQQQHRSHSLSGTMLSGQQHAPSPRPKQKKAQHTAQQQTPTALASAAEASSRASTSSKHSRRSRHQQEQASASAHAAVASPGCSSSAAEEMLGDMSGVHWEDVEEQGPFFCLAPKPDSRPSISRRRSTAGAGPDFAAPSPCEHLGRAGISSSAGSGSTASGSSPQQQRHTRMDKDSRRLLQHLLTGFMADSSQREMTFPASLSAADRYHVHVAAEAYGLAHASHSEAGDRVIKVWKVSRTRKAYSGGSYVSDDGSD